MEKFAIFGLLVLSSSAFATNKLNTPPKASFATSSTWHNNGANQLTLPAPFIKLRNLFIERALEEDKEMVCKGYLQAISQLVSGEHALGGSSALYVWADFYQLELPDEFEPNDLDIYRRGLSIGVGASRFFAKLKRLLEDAIPIRVDYLLHHYFKAIKLRVLDLPRSGNR